MKFPVVMLSWDFPAFYRKITWKLKDWKLYMETKRTGFEKTLFVETSCTGFTCKSMNWTWDTTGARYLHGTCLSRKYFLAAKQIFFLPSRAKSSVELLKIWNHQCRLRGAKFPVHFKMNFFFQNDPPRFILNFYM